MFKSIKKSLNSRNFFISILNVIFGAFAINGIDFNIPAEDVVNVFTSKDLTAILMMIAVNFIGPLFKLIQKEVVFTFDFLKSKNFWMQSSTFIVALLASLGIMIPEGGISSTIDAIFGGEFNLIVMALVANVLLPVYYFIWGNKDEEDKVEKIDLKEVEKEAIKEINVAYEKAANFDDTPKEKFNLFGDDPLK